ncbi:protein FAR1-RELATED SEQUENCE 5-like [Carya illinoinensis]|uniref:protein FAR1-RELATED SEQUENCE 5-like n=1 Tax=Carya illinoinensis TaxID=32201 RepID=UPI001C725919|nr:protein FAR1-RELATED SEQUENCE 5-like [Carya illinoinensis]
MLRTQQVKWKGGRTPESLSEVKRVFVKGWANLVELLFGGLGIVIMGIGEEHSLPLTPSTSNTPTPDIPITCSSFANYMPGYYGAVPRWSPTFLPYPDGNQYPFQYRMRPPLPVINTCSATSTTVDKDKEDGVNCVETESPCTSSRIVETSKEDRRDSMETDDKSAGTPQIMQIDGDDLIEEPKSGMQFNSFEELIEYYKEYAKKCGFGVMTQRSERGEDGSVRYVTLGCVRGGKARNRTLNVAKPRPTGKTDCKAKINALKVEGKLQLTTVQNGHNHGLSPQKSRFFRCNREVSDSVKRVLDTNDLAGIRMNKSFGSLVVGAGGFENLPFLEKDCRNYIDKARHLRLGKGGAGALREYFCRMQYKNDGFFALMDLDDDGRLKNVFWADPRSRAAYQYFGLISSEDTETFIWLFETWLQCMNGIAPKAIIIDQDRAMKNAIATVFPETRHRFCLWHILKKVPEKLGSHSAYKTGLKNQLMKCVYDTQSIEEFESCWNGFINTFNLHENSWLQSLYAERGHWVPTNLKEFVDQFDNALKKKIENENNSDFHSFNVSIPCISRSPIEKKFQELYTNAKFREVQQQVMGVLDMDPSILKRDGGIKTYLVDDEVHVEEFSKCVTYSVEFNEEDCDAKCSCGLFQMRGILCRHILAIFKYNQIKSLPAKYILDRWRKDIKRRYTLIRSSYDVGDHHPDANRYSRLLNICYQMITYAAGSNEHTEDAEGKLYGMIDLYRHNQQAPSMTRTGSNVDCPQVEPTTVDSSKVVLSLLVVRGKGRPPSLRRASTMEKRVLKVKAKKQKPPVKAHVKGKRKQVRYNGKPLYA